MAASLRASVESRTEAMAEPKPNLEIRRTGFSLLVVGEVDLSNANVLGEALRAEVDEFGEAVVDLTGCTYLGSEGIRVVIEAWQRIRQDGRLLLSGAPPHVRSVLEVAGLGRLPGLEIEGDA